MTSPSESDLYVGRAPVSVEDLLALARFERAPRLWADPAYRARLDAARSAVERQLDFSSGTLGLWSSNHFVIYYRDGRVPQPGIILIGRVTDDVSIFDRPGPVSVRVERIK